MAGACAITDTGPPVTDPVPPPLVATWCACFAFSAALFLTILQKINLSLFLWQVYFDSNVKCFLCILVGSNQF